MRFSALKVATPNPRPFSGRGFHARTCLTCTYRVRPLSGGDDVTGRLPGCGRDFASDENGRRGLKRRAEWAWLLVMQIYGLNIKRRVS